MRAKLLAVASLAVHVPVGTIASNDGVQGLVTIFTLEALAMPLSSFGQNFFGSEHHTATAWTSLSRGRLDGGGIDHRCLRCSITVTTNNLVISP